MAIEHAQGEFTPDKGKNAGTKQYYDIYRLHTLKPSRDTTGNVECVIVRCKPEQMGDIIAECGGKLENVVGRTLDMEVSKAFGKVNLDDFEVVG